MPDNVSENALLILLDLFRSTGDQHIMSHPNGNTHTVSLEYDAHFAKTSVNNLTRFNVHLYTSDGKHLLKTIPPSGNRAQWRVESELIGHTKEGFPLYENRFIVSGLLAKHDGTIYIVDDKIQLAFPERDDLFSVDLIVQPVRDMYNKVIGVTRLMRYKNVRFVAAQEVEQVDPIGDTRKHHEKIVAPPSLTAEQIVLAQLEGMGDKSWPIPARFLKIVEDCKCSLYTTDDGYTFYYAWWDAVKKRLCIQQVGYDRIKVRRGTLSVEERGEMIADETTVYEHAREWVNAMREIAPGMSWKLVEGEQE